MKLCKYTGTGFPYPENYFRKIWKDVKITDSSNDCSSEENRCRKCPNFDGGVAFYLILNG